ncbi:MAG: hypothetical protein IJW48_04835 [Clostridia bacterium]|nr:hypothetical protein [Clostridia bacterium]
MAKSKNLLTSRSAYNRSYGDFRGVDFSSDHATVHDSRFAYAVNMYKDYQSGQGAAVETIPGFRRRFYVTDGSPIYGIHKWSNNGCIRDTTGDGEAVYTPFENKFWWIHAGDKLYQLSLSLTDELDLESEDYSGKHGDSINGIYISNDNTKYINTWKTIEGVNPQKSVSFNMRGCLYLLDGKNYYCLGATGQKVTENAYIPTIYAGIAPGMTKEEIAACKYEQANLLSNQAKFTFVADGTTTKFYFPKKVYDTSSVFAIVYNKDSRYNEGLIKDVTNEYIEFSEAPASPENAGYEVGYAGIEVTVPWLTGLGIGSEAITHCTLATEFDGRIFLSGNPLYPNHLYWCGYNSDGYIDPSYFGCYNYMEDGDAAAPITGMIVVGNYLAVLKCDDEKNGVVYYHARQETGSFITPTIYPSQRGVHSIGCLGACTNFLDDPVFISKLGVEGIGALSLHSERKIEHRSSLIDAKLRALNLEKSELAEWNGYLVLLVDGKIFLADSRQSYTHSTGVVQYEWYYIEDIGIWDGQYEAFRYADSLPDALTTTDESGNIKGIGVYVQGYGPAGGDDQNTYELVVADRVYNEITEKYEDLRGSVAKLSPRSEIYTCGFSGAAYGESVYCAYIGDGKMALLEDAGYQTGGTFVPATTLHICDGNLFFGTANGYICSFNFDKRNEYGEIPTRYYTFDGRIIKCGVATKMDNCGIPNFTKNTVKKTTVIKTKGFQSTAAKIKVRTNNDPYRQIDRINSSSFTFEDLNFSDLSFSTTDQTLFSVKEKEKRWVEKQYYIYSDEVMKPFSLLNITFQYTVAGKYKGEKQ